MNRTILIYGLIAAIVVAVPLFAIGTLMRDNPPPGAVGMAIGYLTMLIAFTAIFAGIKQHRDVALGGAIRFWPALGMGVAIALIGSLGYVVMWEAVLALNEPDFVARMAARMVEERRAAGATAPELAAYKAQMDAGLAQYANPLIRIPITLTEVFPIGLLVALISAALLRNPRFLMLPANRTAVDRAQAPGAAAETGPA